jgi:hypothetical protein
MKPWFRGRDQLYHTCKTEFRNTHARYQNLEISKMMGTVRDKLGVACGGFFLATVHEQDNSLIKYGETGDPRGQF